MTEDERVDLDALRPSDAVRERVVRAAMADIREHSVSSTASEAAPGWARVALLGSGRFLRPVLAAAAFVALLLVFPGRTRHPEVVAADVFLSHAVGVPDDWLQWALRDAEPDPAQLLVLYGEASR